MMEDQNYIQQPPVPPPYHSEENIPPLKPNTWLWQSVVVTLCCFTLFGVIALVNSVQVNSAYFSGDYEKAERASRRAKMWSITGLIAGIVYTIIMIFVMIKGNYFDEINSLLNDGAHSIYNY